MITHTSSVGLRSASSLATDPYYGHTLYHLSSDGKVTAHHHWNEHNEADRPADQRSEDDLTSKFDGRVIDIIVGAVGNGAISTIFFLQENGKVAWIDDPSLARDSNQPITYIENAQDIVRLYGNTSYIDIAGFAQNKSGEIYALKPIISDSHVTGYILE